MKAPWTRESRSANEVVRDGDKAGTLSTLTPLGLGHQYPSLARFTPDFSHAIIQSKSEWQEHLRIRRLYRCCNGFLFFSSRYTSYNAAAILCILRQGPHRYRIHQKSTVAKHNARSALRRFSLAHHEEVPILSTPSSALHYGSAWLTMVTGNTEAHEKCVTNTSSQHTTTHRARSPGISSSIAGPCNPTPDVRHPCPRPPPQRWCKKTSSLL